MTDVETPAPHHADAGAGDDVEIRPWWQNPVTIAVLALAVVVLAVGAGYVVGYNQATPDRDEADVGFLHDMREHHEQAVQMGLVYLADPDVDPEIAKVARSIVVGQSIEIGRMVQMLRNVGAPEVRDGDVAMAWMGQPVPADQMPGLATDEQIEQLAAATGADADVLFVELMVAHHRGGIHMAEDIVSRGHDDEVVAMAASMAGGQQEEIAELEGLLPR